MDFYFSFGKKKHADKNTVISAALLWVILDPLIDWVIDLLNSHALKKFGGENLKLLFDELDSIWLKDSKNKKYSDSDVRIIISMLVKILEDNELTRKELLSIVDFVQRKWVPSIAAEKVFTHTEEVLEARIEAVVENAIDVYNKTYMEKPQTPEEFVASTAEIIFHQADNSKAQALLGGMMEIRNKLIF